MVSTQAAAEAVLHTELVISFVVFPRHVFWALAEDLELGNVTKKVWFALREVHNSCTEDQGSQERYLR